jgi:hypothetical protein
VEDRAPDPTFDELLDRRLQTLGEAASDSSLRALEEVLGRVVEAYGRALLRREDGSVPAADSGDQAPPFPVELPATAVMLAVDRLLQAADVDIFELALWHHMGRYRR